MLDRLMSKELITELSTGGDRRRSVELVSSRTLVEASCRAIQPYLKDQP